MDSSSYEIETKSSRRSNVEKNYAPCMIPNKGPTPTSLIFNERMRKTRSLFLKKLRQTSELKQAAMAADVKVSKISSSQHAQARIEARKSRYSEYVAVPVNLSHWLNLFQNRNLSYESRLFQYSKKHKCPHGYCWTSFILHSSVKKDGRKQPVYVEPKCHCATETVLPIKETHSCGNCTSRQLNLVRDNTFPGKILRCLFCKFSWYNSIGWLRVRPMNLTVVRDKVTKPSTQKTWAALPPQVVDAEKEFGPDITGMFSGLFTKIADMAKSVLAWIGSLAINKVVKDSLGVIWEIISQLVHHASAAFMKNPMAVSYNAFRLFQTESSMERVFLIGLIVNELSCENLYHRLLESLGMSWSVPTGLKRRINCEKQLMNMEDVVRAEKARMDAADLAHQHAMAKEREELRTYVVPKNGGDCAVFDAQKESGFNIAELLFKFTSWLPIPKAMDLVKNFNSIMSGWKNLHELANNMLQHLPGWLQKLFTITDPRKRYGVEAKTPGNPIYQMVQHYLELLRGENCASPSVYEAFTRSWKDADLYIASEFQPNEFVNRLHQHYRVNAAAIMRPGTRGSKPVPFVVTLFGKPGTGKSATWPILLSGIVRGSVSEIRGMSYTRNPCADYFDGYNPEKHKIFIYDDFGSQVDDESMGELMSIVSNADYLPPYASLNDPNVGVKGTSFNSPLVVLCSNFQNFSHCKQIADKSALQRRLGIVIEWNSRFAPGNRYMVSRATTAGNLEPILRASGGNYYTVPEIQDLLAQEYVKHMRDQISRDDFFNQHISTAPIADFQRLYNEVKVTVTRDGAVDAVRESGLVKMITAYSVVAFTHQLVDYVDYRTQGWGNFFLAGLGMLVTAYGAYRLFFGVQEESGEGHIAKTVSKPIFSRIVASRKEVGEQADENTLNYITRGHVVIVDDKGLFVSGLFVTGRILLTVKHFVKVAERLTVHTHRASDTEVFMFSVGDCRVVELDGVDLALVECPLHVNPFPSTVKYFSDEVLTKETEGFVTRRTRNAGLLVYNVKAKPARVMLRFSDRDGNTTMCAGDLEYEFHHERGDCGNVIMANQGGSLKIIGIHESGSISDANRSFASLVNRTELQNALKKFDATAKYPRQEDFPHENAIYEQGSSFNKTMFVAYSDKHISASGETDLRPSLVHDKVRLHTTEPSILRRKGDLDPMTKALNKYGLSTEQFPFDATHQAIQSLTEELKSHVSDDDFTPLTLHEALNGIPGLVESVDLTTSSGYPFSLNPATRGEKRKVIEGEPGQLTLSSIAQAHYDSWGKLLDEGVVPSDPFLATLKSEPRPAAKVALGKTRVFCAGSLTSFLYNKRYLAKFSAFLKRTRSKTFSTIGFNRGSLEWDEMMKRFLEVGEEGLDGDQEEWDGRFKAYIAMAIVDLIAEICGYAKGSIEYQHLYILFLHAVFTYLRITWNFGEGLITVIIEICGSMPSGWFATLLLNSLVNAILFRIAWILLVSSPFNDLSYFRTYTREKYTGDDNFLAVARAFLHEYNNITIAELFRYYGQKYTPAAKQGELVPYQKLEDCLFLKTKTGRLFDRFVPLFDMDANFSTVNWIRKCDDHHFATESNCNDALRNLFFYGKDTFNHWRSEMLRALPTMKLLSFHSLESAYLGYGSIPDPFGTFGFTKNATRDPTAFYRAVLHTVANSNQ